MIYKVKFFRIATKFIDVTKIDLYELIDLLKNLGYNITAPHLPFRGFKATISGSGPVAVKGNVVVDVNTERLIIGVSSPEPEDCISEFVVIEKAVTSKFDALKKPYFYELLAELEIGSDGIEPMEFLQKISKGNLVAKKISNALGESLFVFGYRLAKENTSPESNEWVDIEIIPYLVRPHSSMYVSVVYRSKNREKVLKAGRKLAVIADALSDLINSVKE